MNMLNGLLLSLENQLNNFKKLYKDRISKMSFEITKIFLGYSLVIMDLTEWTKDGWAKTYRSGKFTRKGEEYFELIKVLLTRESAWAVSQACEAFERHLKDISATFLLENQKLAETKKVEKFEFELDKKSHNLSRTDITFWKRYVDYRNKTNTERLKFLRKICPDISKGETENNRCIDLREWFVVAEEVRHSVTHSNLIIKTSRIKDWSEAKRNILKKYFPGKNLEQGYQLDITSENARFCLTLFSEYSFQIYKFLSISRDYDWNILKKEKGNNCTTMRST